MRIFYKQLTIARALKSIDTLQCLSSSIDAAENIAIVLSHNSKLQVVNLSSIKTCSGQLV